MDYMAMYFHLFNAVTDALELIDRGLFSNAKTLLTQAQQNTEEMFMAGLPDEETEAASDRILDEITAALLADMT